MLVSSTSTAVVSLVIVPFLETLCRDSECVLLLPLHHNLKEFAACTNGFMHLVRFRLAIVRALDDVPYEMTIVLDFNNFQIVTCLSKKELFCINFDLIIEL